MKTSLLLATEADEGHRPGNDTLIGSALNDLVFDEVDNDPLGGEVKNASHRNG